MDGAARTTVCSDCHVARVLGWHIPARAGGRFAAVNAGSAKARHWL
jgi:hypothetical protein